MDLLVDFLLNFYGPTPYLLVFGILLLCGFGVPIPEDVALFAAGLLAYYGVVDLWVMIAVGFAGVMAGDSIMWYLGHKYGRRLMKKSFFQKLLPEERIQMASTRLNRKGAKRLLFAGRFMPGLRAPIYFTSGFLHVPFWRFFIMDGLAAMVSVPLIIGAVFHFGDELDVVVRWIKKIEHGILFIIFGVAVVVGTKWWLTHRRARAGNIIP
ncbi:MAG: DedA family protein [Cryobacterium sp.]|nr:DedA family protein [Oligoflexia bacterium]